MVDPIDMWFWMKAPTRVMWGTDPPWEGQILGAYVNYMASAECEPIMGVCSRAPGQGARGAKIP